MIQALSREIGRAFYGSFSSLQPTQETDAIETILNDDGALIIPPTGSGKIETAVAPLVDLYCSMMRETNGSTSSYITPTRDLAKDLLRRL